MSMSTIPPLKLFPLYRGAPVRETRFGTIDSFRTQATEFSSAYRVNIPTSDNPFQDGRFISLNENGGLTQTALSANSPFNRNLSIDATPGRLQEASIPATPPDIPSQYEDITSQYSIADGRFSELMTQPTFSIPIGPGLLVTTDGQGGIADVAIQPDAASLTSLAGQTLPDRAAIVAGALFKVDPTIPGGLTGKTMQPQALKPPNAPSPSTSPSGPFTPSLNPAGLKPGVPFDSLRADAVDSNPILARLRQLSAPGNGLAISGVDSQVNVEQARRLASVQAGFEVPLSPTFRRNTAELASQARFQENYGAMYRLSNPERLLDGRMPTVPSLPNPPLKDGAGVRTLGSALAEADDVLDAGSRRMSGGYLAKRFSWQSGAGGLESGTSGFEQGQSGHGRETRSFMSGFGTDSGQSRGGSPFAFRRPGRTFTA